MTTPLSRYDNFLHFQIEDNCQRTHRENNLQVLLFSMNSCHIKDTNCPQVTLVMLIHRTLMVASCEIFSLGIRNFFQSIHSVITNRAFYAAISPFTRHQTRNTQLQRGTFKNLLLTNRYYYGFVQHEGIIGSHFLIYWQVLGSSVSLCTIQPNVTTLHAEEKGTKRYHYYYRWF